VVSRKLGLKKTCSARMSKRTVGYETDSDPSASICGGQMADDIEYLQPGHTERGMIMCNHTSSFTCASDLCLFHLSSALAVLHTAAHAAPSDADEGLFNCTPEAECTQAARMANGEASSTCLPSGLTAQSTLWHSPNPLPIQCNPQCARSRLRNGKSGNRADGWVVMEYYILL